MTRILVEGRNLAIPRGTGIATYVRSLGYALRRLGFSTDVLFHAEFALYRTKPQLNEIALFDFEYRRQQKIAEYMRRAKWLRYLALDWLPQSPSVVANSGIIADTTPFWGLEGFERRLAIEDLFDRANLKLKLWNGTLKVRRPNGVELFHATHPTSISVSGVPNIQCVHDIVPLRVPHATLDKKKTFRKIIAQVCRKADHVVAVSEQTRQDLIQYFRMDEKRVSTTYQAVEIAPRHFRRSPEDSMRDLTGLQIEADEYFLFVGAIEPKKNVKRLLEAYFTSGVKRKLVVVGPHGWSANEEMERMSREGIARYERRGSFIVPEKNIIHVPYAPYSLLVSLLRHSRALLFPSIYEGFGLPVVEAMALGAPVLTSNVSSLPEVAGDAAELVDPFDIVAMSRAIARLDVDNDLRQELRRRGIERAKFFSLDRYCARLEDAYAKVGVSAPSSVRVNERTAIARPPQQNSATLLNTSPTG